MRVINETQRNEERTPECTSRHPARVHSFGNPELFARSRARAWGLRPFAVLVAPSGASGLSTKKGNNEENKRSAG